MFGESIPKRSLSIFISLVLIFLHPFINYSVYAQSQVDTDAVPTVTYVLDGSGTQTDLFEVLVTFSEPVTGVIFDSFSFVNTVNTLDTTLIDDEVGEVVDVVGYTSIARSTTQDYESTATRYYTVKVEPEADLKSFPISVVYSFAIVTASLITNAAGENFIPPGTPLTVAVDTIPADNPYVTDIEFLDGLSNTAVRDSAFDVGVTFIESVKNVDIADFRFAELISTANGTKSTSKGTISNIQGYSDHTFTTTQAQPAKYIKVRITPNSGLNTIVDPFNTSNNVQYAFEALVHATDPITSQATGNAFVKASPIAILVVPVDTIELALTINIYEVGTESTTHSIAGIGDTVRVTLATNEVISAAFNLKVYIGGTIYSGVSNTFQTLFPGRSYLRDFGVVDGYDGSVRITARIRENPGGSTVDIDSSITTTDDSSSIISDVTSNVTVDTTAPTDFNILAPVSFPADLAADVLVLSDPTPSFELYTQGGTSLIVSGDCVTSNSTHTVADGNTTITLGDLVTDGTVNDCKFELTDDAGNSLAKEFRMQIFSGGSVLSVTGGVNSVLGISSPSFDLTSTKAGSVSISENVAITGSTADCAATDKTIEAGTTKTIYFDSLTNGTHNCVVTLTASEDSQTYSISLAEFTVNDTLAINPTVSSVTTYKNNKTNDASPTVIVTATEAGTIQESSVRGCFPEQANRDIVLGANSITFIQIGSSSVESDLSDDTHTNCQFKFTDLAGNTDNTFITVPTFIVDTAAPILAVESVKAFDTNGVEKTNATTGDTITITVTTNETLSDSDEPTFTSSGYTVGGTSITLTDTTFSGPTNSKYTHSYTVDSTTPEGELAYIFTAKDEAGNITTVDSANLTGKTLSVDTTNPTLSTVSIASSSTTTYAKAGDTITLTITSSEALNAAPTFTNSEFKVGTDVVDSSAIFTATTNTNEYNYTYTVLADDTGVATFAIDPIEDTTGLKSSTTTTTTDSSAITVDTTAFEFGTDTVTIASTDDKSVITTGEAVTITITTTEVLGSAPTFSSFTVGTYNTIPTFTKTTIQSTRIQGCIYSSSRT